ncbi:hypothetical protein [Gordonia hankookensis]|uniref:Uncharacterized protein n=1 Tax=Gordonia hankookensis TaxID=589403 RepID=A0ABR7WB44_9ACTN|nr:hypothetical protein [Gordonia hankookensis]MBD1319771.1 hypothetical protein [Gordonia hankookensis]
MTYIWANRTKHVFRTARFAAVGLLALGGVLLILGFAIELWALVAGGAGFALMAIATVLPFATRIEMSRGEAVVHAQPWYRNSQIVFTAAMALITVTMVVEIAAGASQSWRLVIPAIAGVAVTPYLVVLAYRDRGPLRISAQGVELGNGAVFEYRSTCIEFVELNSGVPAVRLTSDIEAPTRSARIISRGYNIDFNSLLSTLEQLKVWDSQSRCVSSAAIAAMLTADLPKGVGLGESVELTVPVGGGS